MSVDAPDRPPAGPLTGPVAGPPGLPNDPPRPPDPEVRYDPPRRLVPSPASDRPWRTGTVLVGGGVVLLLVLVLAATSAATWVNARRFTEVPATTTLGAPTSLSVGSTLGTVRVQPSDEVDEVVLSLVEPGTTVPAAEGDMVRARIERSGGADATVVRVSQPEEYTGVPGVDRARDVLVLVPSGHVMDLDLSSTVGDVVADGEFSAVNVRADVGDVHLGPVSAPDGLTVSTDIGGIDVETVSPAPTSVELTSSLGDVSLRLPADAGGEVSLLSELGDLRIAVAGTSRWGVETSTGLGTEQIDPGLTDGSGAPVGTLSARTETGDVTITR